MNLNIPPQSASAAARVSNKIPAPTHCRYCGSAVSLVNNLELYGRSYGQWPFGYYCGFCEAYVGTHPRTHIPLGTMATSALRKKRMEAHEAFDPIWRSGKVSRGQAYHLLACALKIPKGECHMSWFEAEQCDQVIAAAPKIKQNLGIK